MIANGDILDYEDGLKKIHESTWHPNIDPASETILDGMMIGRSSFGNPWCFLPGRVTPPLSEVLNIMTLHGQWLSERKGRKGILEARKHLVQYLHSLPGVKDYRKSLVTVESVEDINTVIEKIRQDLPHLLSKPLSIGGVSGISEGWGDSCSLATD